MAPRTCSTPDVAARLLHGVRVSELCSIEVADVDLENCNLL